MDQMIRCPVCDHTISLHLKTGCQGVRLRKCLCKFTPETVLEKAVGLVRTGWPKPVSP